MIEVVVHSSRLHRVENRFFTLTSPPETLASGQMIASKRGRLIAMASAREIEIKFRVADVRALARKLRSAGFRLVTLRKHETNTLYDLPGEVLRKRKQLLRLRKYGSEWTLTHKSGKKTGRHSSREELETRVSDGKEMELILLALGYASSFCYEKFRAEWTDGKGQVVVDETPIGDFCEIEGAPRWIDSTAKRLGVSEADYITKNYAGLFSDWKARARSKAREMTFMSVGRPRRQSR
jgi:adenylate cyclase, class 2